VGQWRREISGARRHKLFWRPLLSPLFPSSLIRSRGLKSRPLKPSYGVWESTVSFPSEVWGEASAANNSSAFSGPRNATALIYAHNLCFHAHPCLNRAHRICVYFQSQKITAPALNVPPSDWRPGAYAPLPPTRRHCASVPAYRSPSGDTMNYKLDVRPITL